MKIGLLIQPWIAQRAGIHQFTRQLAGALERSGKHDYYLLGSQSVPSDLPQLCIPSFAESYTDPRRWILGAKNPGLDWIIDPAHMGALGLFPGARRCTIVHDLTPIHFPHYHRLTSVIGYHMLFRRALDQSEAIVAISKQTEEDLRGFARSSALERIHHAYPGFQPPSIKTKPLDLPGERFFLSVGTAEPRKNLGRIIKAFEQFLERSSGGEHLVIVGPDGWKEPIDKRIQESSARNYIVRLGFVEPEELQWLYGQALGLVYVSLYEGFGFPILEAMQAGCPVITSSTGSMAEIAEGYALTVDAHDEQAIAEALQQLVKDKELARELAAKGRERQAVFQWDRFVSSVEQRFFS